MLDLFETMFIWSIYIVVPTILITRFLGSRRADFIFTGVIALYQTADINQINFPIEIESSKDSTTILAKNTRDKSKEKTFPIINRKNKKNFDQEFHSKLEKHFPNWDECIAFQRKQEKLHRSAMKKQRELRRTGMMDIPSRYAKAELDAISYFEGTGFYSKVQDSSKNPKPCIYDTRQSFLIKMQDKKFQFSIKR